MEGEPGTRTPSPVTGSGSPLQVPAAIGPGLLAHALSPLHAFVPMAPSDPRAKACTVAVTGPGTHVPLETHAGEIFVAAVLGDIPGVSETRSVPTHALSPTEPSLPSHAARPW